MVGRRSRCSLVPPCKTSASQREPGRKIRNTLPIDLEIHVGNGDDLARVAGEGSKSWRFVHESSTTGLSHVTQYAAVRLSGFLRSLFSHLPGLWLKALLLMKPKLAKQELTVCDFFRELAKPDGFLGRKHDGEPGWQSIWAGYKKLHGRIEGMKLLMS